VRGQRQRQHQVCLRAASSCTALQPQRAPRAPRVRRASGGAAAGAASAASGAWIPPSCARARRGARRTRRRPPRGAGRTHAAPFPFPLPSRRPSPSGPHRRAHARVPGRCRRWRCCLSCALPLSRVARTAPPVPAHSTQTDRRCSPRQPAPRRAPTPPALLPRHFQLTPPQRTPGTLPPGPRRASFLPLTRTHTPLCLPAGAYPIPCTFRPAHNQRPSSSFRRRTSHTAAACCSCSASRPHAPAEARRRPAAPAMEPVPPSAGTAHGRTRGTSASSSASSASTSRPDASRTAALIGVPLLAQHPNPRRTSSAGERRPTHASTAPLAGSAEAGPSSLLASGPLSAPLSTSHKGLLASPSASPASRVNAGTRRPRGTYASRKRLGFLLQTRR
jgi:hypothetical protein